MNGGVICFKGSAVTIITPLYSTEVLEQTPNQAYKFNRFFIIFSFSCCQKERLAQLIFNVFFID